MKRSEVWVVSAKGPIAKPRPAVIMQNDLFSETSTLTVCAFTTDPTEALLIRPVIDPSVANGLTAISRAMVDRLTTVDRAILAKRIGELNAHEMEKIQRSILLFLGIE